MQGRPGWEGHRGVLVSSDTSTTLVSYTFDHKLGIGRESISWRARIAPRRKAGPRMPISMFCSGLGVRGQDQPAVWMHEGQEGR